LSRIKNVKNVKNVFTSMIHSVNDNGMTDFITQKSQYNMKFKKKTINFTSKQKTLKNQKIDF